MQGGKSVTITEKVIRYGSGTSPPESGIDIINSGTTASKSTLREDSHSTDINSVGQQPACKRCLAQDARIMELEEAVRAHMIKSAEDELMHRSTDGYHRDSRVMREAGLNHS